MDKYERREFQSTLPVRGATSRPIHSAVHCSYFNPRSPYGERLQLKAAFRSRRISIHAPRTGSDTYQHARFASALYFNPRSPYGERLPRPLSSNGVSTFQSTLPVRGATRLPSYPGPPVYYFNPRSPYGERPGIRLFRPQEVSISIHAPRTGSDISCIRCGVRTYNFNPRSPYGERLYVQSSRHSIEIISIHAPRTGSDDAVRITFRRYRLFQSTLPVRGATHEIAKGAHLVRHFNPRSPYGERLIQSPLICRP